MVAINAQPFEPLIEKEIAQRAYEYWIERGRPFGSPETDWYRAVEEVHRELSARGIEAIRL